MCDRDRARAVLVRLMNQAYEADRLVRCGQPTLAIEAYSRVIEALDGHVPDPAQGVPGEQPSIFVSPASKEELQESVELLRARILSRAWQHVRIVSPLSFGWSRRTRWLLHGVVIVGLLALAAWYRTQAHEVSIEAKWSWVGQSGKVTRGTLPRHGLLGTPGGYFVHTDCEAKPRLDIELDAIYRVQSVIILNRRDCCQERARTVEVLTSEDGSRFESAARHDPHVTFDEWHASFAPRKARYVRLQLAENDCLHFSEVRVFGK